MKKKIKILITTTFKKYEEYEAEDDETESEILDRAYYDTDLLDDALDNARFDTNIEIIKE